MSWDQAAVQEDGPVQELRMEVTRKSMRSDASPPCGPFLLGRIVMDSYSSSHVDSLNNMRFLVDDDIVVAAEDRAAVGLITGGSMVQ